MCAQAIAKFGGIIGHGSDWRTSMVRLRAVLLAPGDCYSSRPCAVAFAKVALAG